MLVDAGQDRLLELRDAAEDAATDAFGGDLGEEAFHLVEPRGSRGSEVQDEARMAR